MNSRIYNSLNLTKDLHRRGHVDLPNWAGVLHLPYWVIRVEGRDKAKRRRYYRQVEKIKLQLVELGHDHELVNAICFFLATHRKSAASEVKRLLDNPNPQLTLKFY